MKYYLEKQIVEIEDLNTFVVEYFIKYGKVPEIRFVETFVDPKICSIKDLQEIIESDPFCSPKYIEELERKQRKEKLINYYEEKYENN